jgi:hypothetical protein
MPLLSKVVKTLKRRRGMSVMLIPGGVLLPHGAENANGGIMIKKVWVDFV